MTIEDFASHIKENIRGYLPDSYADADIEVRNVVKNNDTHLTGISIQRKDRNMCPTLYLEEAFNEYNRGVSFEDIICQLVSATLRNDCDPGFDVTRIKSWEFCKDKIFPRLINFKKNEGILSERPHREMADLSITYQVSIVNDCIGNGNIAVSYDLMNIWGVNENELYSAAIYNLATKEEITLKSLSGMISELLSDSGMNEEIEQMGDDTNLFVLTNKKRYGGASVVLDSLTMKEICKKFHDGFFLLPSSVHEFLVVPRNGRLNLKDLEEMVRSVNQTSVENEDQLSDNVYVYSAEEGLKIAV